MYSLNKMLTTSCVVFFLALTVCSVGNYADDSSVTSDKARVFVSNVKQNYEESINEMLEQQIRTELEASYVYQAYASYFQRADVNLPGVQKFFADASAEEKQHAQMLIEYVNKRGGHVLFKDVNLINTCTAVKDQETKYYVDGDDNTRMCICSFVWPKEVHDYCPPRRSMWKNALFAFEDALATERYVNDQLLKVHEQADKVNDAQLAHFLEHDFLDEQVQAINQLGHFVSRLRSFKGDSYSVGEYLFDQNMSK